MYAIAIIRRSFLAKADATVDRIRFPELVEGFAKQGKSGSDVLASREALSPRMRERGNGTDES